MTPLRIGPALFAVALLLCLAVPSYAASTQAVFASPPPTSASAISISLLPDKIAGVGGKFPAGLSNFAVFEGDCDVSKGTPLLGYKVIITGNGVSLSDQTAFKCSITASLSVDPNAAPGKRTVVLVDSSGARVASADLQLVSDASAGAIPSGLEPDVDVMWNVMSQNNCADAFGTRLAASLYCIQIKIGNNSGHPLQLAGIGFANNLTNFGGIGDLSLTVANSSYASTRAILLHQEMWAPRNVLYHSLEGTGLIMAGFIPYFTRTNAKANFSTAVSIVAGPLLQAFNLVGPDPILSQLSNLDDQSFRDGLVIANNSQIQTVVFVEKEAVTQSLHNLESRISSKSPGVAGCQDVAQPANDRSGGDATAQLCGALRASIRNSRVQGKHDPMLVQIALGQVVIVGQEIEYLQRVEVQTSGQSTTGVNINPAAISLPVDAKQQFTATVSGDQNAAGVTWSLSGTDCKGNDCGTLGDITSTSVSYTAPNAPPVPESLVNLTGTSNADHTKSGIAKITITRVLSAAVASGSGQETPVSKPFAKPLVVTVTDSAGKPLSGQTVTFALPTSGASGSFSGGITTAQTNSNGQATSATLTANGTTGSYTVQATVQGGIASANFTLTNIAQ